MDFNKLSSQIENAQNLLQHRALQTVNQLLVVRNWLIGHYIVAFEQNGEDRAKYGAKTLKKLAETLKQRGLKGFSFSNLKLFRQFYNSYPQLQKPIAKHFSSYLSPISQPVADQLENGVKIVENKSLRAESS